jgi:hypothetical protein
MFPKKLTENENRIVLYHEIANRSMKNRAIIVTFLTQFDEILARFRHDVAMQLEIQRPEIRQ